MNTTQTGKSILQKPLRLWPGVVIVILQWLLRFVLPIVAPNAVAIAVISGLAGGLAIVVWWLFFSRAAWLDRLAGVGLMAVSLYVTTRFLDKSLATGAQGMLFFVLAVPVLSLAFVACTIVSRHLGDGPRRVAMALSILLACSVWTLIKTGGFTGNFENDLKWRWTKTPEEQLLSQKTDESIFTQSDRTVKPAAEWPGFRGAERDGVARGVRVETDWSHSPPVQLWRRSVGPGWSSFAVRNDFCYTQEQRGQDEFVTCYRIISGKPVWRHGDPARFWESNGGAGPRGTPTLDRNRVYTFGATGILNALDASSGALVWSRNVAADSDMKIPGWGFASSPLVIGDLVVVAADGKLAAYDVNDGKPRWFGPTHRGSYSSPHQWMVDGVPQVLLLSGAGLTSVTPTDGKVLWEYAWEGVTIVQPAPIGDGDILVSTGGGGGGAGIRRMVVKHSPDGWTLTERWTSSGLKPYFNDFVVHKGHAYGFDGSLLACIELEQGKRRWKGGRYGNGQLVLLPDQDALLVVSEKGDLALVSATSDDFKELARVEAIHGKTWNHPVVTGNLLLVRNAEEMAAFQLPSKSL
ncbi:MAG TPA: PQQ-binding-like beta-propeller repeat protein [Candidatus Limnocylindrales bacterium]|jgi:outer membrane protein assembly factor BamB|nr:PQQ-binding-like beta-propeller repeat protein [Candidatus Limnocylindrales bacterium]